MFREESTAVMGRVPRYLTKPNNGNNKSRIQSFSWEPRHVMDAAFNALAHISLTRTHLVARAKEAKNQKDGMDAYEPAQE